MTKQEFINACREFIASGKTDKALTFMRMEVGNFDADSVKDITLLENRYTKSTADFNTGDLPRENYDPIVAQITLALLEMIEKLEKSAPLSIGGAKNKNSGRILHNIPGMMPMGVERRCIVRIAYDDETLLRDLEKDENTTIQSVRIAEVMGVELVDDNETPAFNIRTITEEEQFVSSDDYTQWLFKVKALREGRFPLTLKVAVIEEVNGQQRKREIVLEKEVFIISHIEEPAAAPPSPVVVKNVPPQSVATHFEDTSFRLNYVFTEERGAVATSSPAAKRFSFSTIASTIAVIAVALTGWVAFQTFNSPKDIDIKPNENEPKNGPNKGNTNPNSGSDTSMILEKTPLSNDTLKSQVAENENISGTNKGNETGSTQGTTPNAGQKPDGKIKPNIVVKPNVQNPVQANKGTKPPNVIAKKSPQTKPKTKTPTKPTPPPVTEPKIEIGDIKVVPSTDVSVTKTEPPAEVKTFRVRLVLKGEMKKAEISVDGQSVDKYLKKNIWGTPQYIEFKSSKERHTITFKRGNVSCSVTDVLIENGDLTVEPCSF